MVADGASAVAQVGGWQPEVVMLDLGLPQLDGLEVIRQVRAWSRVPIIVLTVRDAEHDKVTALELGAGLRRGERLAAGPHVHGRSPRAMPG